jgi:cysteinyl-tRNA synthetase
MLHIYNSLTRKKEELLPIEPGKVRMYVCGMTVYDLCHLGHARVMVVFDVVYRYLRECGYEVDYVRNITDIDDKIINRANERGEPIARLTERYIAEMHKDAADLGVLPPTQEPRATAHMGEILAMIQDLVDKGHAYVADNGDVYYAVSSFEGYGRLSGKDPEELRAGARVEVGEAKRDPLDFALWKASKPGEPAWDSPWGPGRPGWHIECSAMSTSCLGSHFDIHGGGADLQFPHHENEIAQSEGATGEPFVDLWMHNGFVRVNEEKMSKSLGNFFTVREILTRYRPEEVRYFILTSHYRSPLNYDDEHLDNARSALTRFYTALRGLPADAKPAGGEAFLERFHEAMDDDFNTPEALAVLFDLVRELNRVREEDARKATGLAARLRELGTILGILQDDPEAYLKHPTTITSAAGITPGTSTAEAIGEAIYGGKYTKDEVDDLVRQREEARKSKNWAEADRIREELQSISIVLEDGPRGTTWRLG